MVVAAGCGSAARQQSSDRGLPRALAREWERQASAVAAASGAGDDCRAMRLAASLRSEVTASRRRVPPRLRSALLTGVNRLAARISTCTRVVTVPVQPTPPKNHEKQPKPHEPPGHHKHKHGDRGGDG